MPNLPPSTDFTNSSVTEGGFKTAMTYMREYLASLLGADGVNSTALATLGAIFGSLTTKSANYTVIASDRGEIIQCTATLELALTAAATLGASFSFVVNNTGSGTVTINPNGTELIDGQATKVIGGNQSAVIYCDGTGFYTVGLSAGGFSNMQVFTSSDGFTTPASTTKLKVTVVGGGGNGGNGTTSPQPVTPIRNRGGGGGGGGYAQAVVPVSASTFYPVTVGGATQTSSFGALISATGGTSGSGSTVGTGGTGVAPTGLVFTGTPGNVFTVAGLGGLTGAGLTNVINSASQSAGNLYGGGGQGGGPGSSPVAQATGGAGASGLVIVEW